MTTQNITTLSNGLRVISDVMPGVATATVGIWVGVGARHEPVDAGGVAHLVEHMLFKGTERRTAVQISEAIEDVGGYLNAYTSREQTAYYAKVLADDLPLAFDVLADMLRNATLDEVELNRERGVILQEIGQSLDTPDDHIFDLLQQSAFPNQMVGAPILGEAEVIRTLPRAALKSYIQGRYTGANIVVSAAGKVDHAVLMRLAENMLGDLAPGVPATSTPSHYKGGDCRVQRDLEQLHLTLGLPGVSYDDPDFYGLEVFSTLLGGGMSSRLFQEVREKRGLVYSIHSFHNPLLDGGLFGIYAGTDAASAPELLPLICDEIKKAAAAVTPAEITRAKAQLRAQLLMGLEGSMTRAETQAQNLLIYGRSVPTEETLARIEAVSASSIATAASRLFHQPPVLATLGDITAVEPFDVLAGRLA
jgi:predicted Zn-dependent peptidase